HTQIMWWVLLVKIADCTETIMFILRNKDKQLSILHLYHHISSVVIAWLIVRYYSEEISTFVSMVNCTVHVFMYIYYFLATFGSRIQAIIMPVKPYITILQMVQFFGLMLYALQFLMPNCQVPNSFGIGLLLNVTINWYLFYKFYKNTYVSSKIKQ
ncbi:elongation of very long chain fatty acids protein AAEL008004-like, partial [Nylanderia fulva]|uniref:elongation of very long chain fatty acids protein AAEL008004-like n=1 Tax=Nylanderia fulva TaxID=613905 RepID=UPI0010FAE4D2